MGLKVFRELGIAPTAYRPTEGSSHDPGQFPLISPSSRAARSGPLPSLFSASGAPQPRPKGLLTVGTYECPECRELTHLPRNT